MIDWRPGIITARCADGDKSLPGWISDPFGIDWAIDRQTAAPVWVIHHLPTGYSVMAIEEGIEEVKQVVALLRSLGDWSFDDPSGIDAFADAVQICRTSGFVARDPRRYGRPLYPDQIAVTA
jgi:hypothetical protein